MEEEAGKLKRKGDGGADAPQELVHAMAAARDADAADMAGKRLRMKRRGEEEAKDGGALDEPHVATASIVAPLAQAGLAAGQALRRRGLGDDKVELAIAAPLIAVPVDSKLKAKKDVAAEGLLASKSALKSKNLQCPLCKKAFKDSSGLKKHTRIHGERKYICGVDGCGKRFVDNSKLKRHQLVHTKQRPYKCDHPGCGKAFSLLYNLRTHTRVHTGEKPFACEYCNKSFAQDSNLKAHKKLHKRVEAADSKMMVRRKRGDGGDGGHDTGDALSPQVVTASVAGVGMQTQMGGGGAPGVGAVIALPSAQATGPQGLGDS